MAFFDEFQHLKIQPEEIKSATDNFSDKKAVGVGGFGKVYKGEISHSSGRSMVAFKRLDSRLGQGNSEFWKEIMMLSRYTHENLVSLLGYCNEGGEKILVYEYASRGSLDRHLSDATLTWTQRLKICIGVARGLSYLHDPNGTQQRVIHRDIKSANILLDENWNAKVSDLGLSKIGPANQQHTVLVSNVVGTFWYLDPVYLEMGLLTKESDVYSFGVVLLEVLCGRLCFEYNDGRCRSLVRLWKQSYKQRKLDEIILHEVMRKINPRSLETFSDIAYLCLQESREERPPMAHVVEKLETALQFQEMYEVMVVPKEYEAILNAAVTPPVFTSEKELKRSLSKGILVNEGKTWFSLNEYGEHCELISARECLNPSADEYKSEKNSKFGEGCCYRAKEMKRFKARVKARFLSQEITYTVNLVFKYFTPWEKQTEPTCFKLKYQLEGEAESSSSYLAHWRENGWMTIELYQFTSDGTSFDLDFRFESTMFNEFSSTIVTVEGIEFRPVSHVKYELFKDDKVEMLINSSVYWEQQLPNDYKQIIKWSKDITEPMTKQMTKEELYHLFRQGFLINTWNGFLSNYGEEWFSLAKNGKKCPMLPASATLVKSDWNWKPLSTSKFKEVAFNCHFKFSIVCKIKSTILSPQTTYACYLVYKITENHSDFVVPLRVLDKEYSSSDHHLDILSYIYLLSPLTRVIRPKDDQNTHNLSDTPKFKGLPQSRMFNGWMEVKVWEFQTGTTFETISMHFELTSVANKRLYGLIVQGIEFKPL